VDWSSSARVARVSSSTSSRPSGPSQSPNKRASQVSMLSKDSNYEVRESNACMPVCPLRHFGPLPPIALSCSTTAKKKSPPSAQKEVGTNKTGSEQRYYARTVYHTKRMKNRGFTRLQHAHKGHREIGTEDMTFSSTFMLDGRERRDDYASTDRKG
jgi:hypothetical protein